MKRKCYSLFLLLIIGGFVHAQNSSKLSARLFKRLSEGNIHNTNMPLLVRGNMGEVEALTEKFGGHYKYGYNNISSIEIPEKNLLAFSQNKVIEKIEGNSGKGVFLMDTAHYQYYCECVRCLKPFRMPFTLEHWACHIPLEGEDKAEVIHDSVDLTPYLREDIFLAFPQHPVCKFDCRGLAVPKPETGRKVDPPEAGASPWAALDKLKLDNR